MNPSPYHDDPSERPDRRLEENDPVWHLLGESARPEPDAWFTVRTLARCRYAAPKAGANLFSWLGMWRWALGGGLSICLAVALMLTQVQPATPAPVMADNNQNKVQEAFEIVASLDTSDSDSSSSSWQDSSR
jgi:hypothetical protein